MKLEGKKVFVASPGGLEEDRKTFFRVVEDFTKTVSIAEGFVYFPVGFEVVMGGVGRPQELINAELRQCDYFWLILHDRWGSSPFRPGEGLYSSGTEEEFNVALQCLEDPNLPMGQVVCTFKGVSPDRLVRPNNQLRKVISFRDLVHSGKAHLTKSYDTQVELESLLRAHLASWLRQDRGSLGQDPGEIESENFRKIFAQSPPEEAPTDAVEQSAAVAVAESRTAKNLLAFGNALLRNGRESAAFNVFEEAVGGAFAEGDTLTASKALSGLGSIYYTGGSLTQAAEGMMAALAAFDASGENGGQYYSELLLNLAVTQMELGTNESAIIHLQKAIALERDRQPELNPLLAHCLSTLSAACLNIRRFDQAKESENESLKIRTLTYGPKTFEVAVSLDHLAMVGIQEGTFTEARRLALEAKRTFQRLRGKLNRHTGMAKRNLARILQAQGKHRSAYAEFCGVVQAYEESYCYTTRMLISPLLEAAQAALYAQNLDGAEGCARRALYLSLSSLNESRYVASAGMALGQVLRQQKRFTEALQAFHYSLGPAFDMANENRLDFNKLSEAVAFTIAEAQDDGLYIQGDYPNAPFFPPVDRRAEDYIVYMYMALGADLARANQLEFSAKYFDLALRDLRSKAGSNTNAAVALANLAVLELIRRDNKTYDILFSEVTALLEVEGEQRAELLSDIKERHLAFSKTINDEDQL